VRDALIFLPAAVFSALSLLSFGFFVCGTPSKGTLAVSSFFVPPFFPVACSFPTFCFSVFSEFFQPPLYQREHHSPIPNGAFVRKRSRCFFHFTLMATCSRNPVPAQPSSHARSPPSLRPREPPSPCLVVHRGPAYVLYLKHYFFNSSPDSFPPSIHSILQSTAPVFIPPPFFLAPTFMAGIDNFPAPDLFIINLQPRLFFRFPFLRARLRRNRPPFLFVFFAASRFKKFCPRLIVKCVVLSHSIVFFFVHLVVFTVLLCLTYTPLCRRRTFFLCPFKFPP